MRRIRLGSAPIGALLLMPGWLLGAFAAQADQLVLTPIKDNTLIEDDPNFSNGAGSNVFIGAIGSGGARRALLKFDLTAIPPGAHITNATLRFVINRAAIGSGLDDSAALHRVTADWGEGSSSTSGGTGTQATPQDATWAYRYYGNPAAGIPRQAWTVVGGDFVPTPTQTITIGSIGAYQFIATPQMIADLQAWLMQPAGNHGWIMLGPEQREQTARRIDSRESGSAANRPTLTVTYLLPAQEADVPLPLWSVGLLACGLLAIMQRARRMS